MPPAQTQLEADYKTRLNTDFNIVFNKLYTLTNMPIMRFGSTLISKGEFDTYMQLLKSAHSESNLATVMCRNLISIDWQGYIYDCDFNQMLDIPSAIVETGDSIDTSSNIFANGVLQGKAAKKHISDINLNHLLNSDILVADHCYGCTAGSGSSCGGALT